MEILCKSYLAALNAGDLEAVLALFTPNAVVYSPLYGKKNARDFYTELFQDTAESETTHINTFLSPDDNSSVALQFKYVWTLDNGEKVEFECVDVFKVCPTSKRFTELKIIYDTYPIRSTHAKSKEK